MNIWLIQTGEPFPGKNVKKMRTAILADKLAEKGHKVTWWTSAFEHLKKEWIYKEDTESIIKDSLKVIALKGYGYRKNISLSRIIDHRRIARKFRKLACTSPEPDIIITSMPPHDLAYESVMFATRKHIPVLVDIRDPWPDIFVNHVPAKFKKVAEIILYNDFRMVKKTMQKASGLIAVTNTFLKWGLKYSNREMNYRDKVFYLGGERLSEGQGQIKLLDYSDKLNNSFVVTFVGTFAHYHNPSILLDVAAKLRGTNIQIVIAGSGEYFNTIKEKASLLNNVTLTGWLSQEEINALLKFSSVGICPTNQVVDLFPNKAFTYLSAGLPLISAFQGDLRELIEKNQIGFYYPPNNTDALVECIRKLYENPVLYRNMSENGKKIFDEMFDAEKIYEKYAEHIEKIAREK